MEIIKRIEIDSVDRDYMQFLNFEKSTYKEIMSYILLEKQQQGYEYRKENYDHFMKEYKEAHIKYDLAFKSFLQHYAPEYLGDNDYIAEFDFENCEILIYKDPKNNCNHCQKSN